MLMDISVYDFTLTRALHRLSLSRTHALLQRPVMRDTTPYFANAVEVPNSLVQLECRGLEIRPFGRALSAGKEF